MKKWYTLLILFLLMTACEVPEDTSYNIPDGNTPETPTKAKPEKLTSQTFFEGTHELMKFGTDTHSGIVAIVGQTAIFAWKTKSGAFLNTEIPASKIRWCPLNSGTPYCKFRWERIPQYSLNTYSIDNIWYKYIIYVEIYCEQNQLLYTTKKETT